MAEFAYFEIVRVRATPRNVTDALAGLEGAVLGKSRNADGQIGYAVALYALDGECWDSSESELEPTGRHDSRESFYDGTAIRVSGDGELLGADDEASPGASARGEPGASLCRPVLHLVDQDLEPHDAASRGR